MAAGQGFKTFNTGDVLTSSDTNGYLMQGVWVFDSSAARSAAVTSPQEGNASFLKDTNSLEIYDGAAWVSYGGGDITGVTAGTGLTGGGTSGDVTITNSMATAIDAKGDLVVGTGADAFSRLAVGTNGQVLQADSTTATGLKWGSASASFVGCSVYANYGQSIPNNTYTALIWQNEDFDTDGFHSTSTNTSRMTIPSGKAGKYQVNVLVNTGDNSTTGARRLRVTKNALNVKETLMPGSTIYPSIQVSLIVNCAETDYLEVYYVQESGSTQTVDTSNGYAHFSIAYLGA